MCVEMWEPREFSRLRRIGRFRALPWYRRFYLRLTGKAPV